MRARPPHSAPPDRTGHADTPRQDAQRPAHADHGDTGGQASSNLRRGRTQRPTEAADRDAATAPGALHADPPLPEGGRQSQRPGQHGRAQESLGARDVETFRSAEPEGFDAGAAARRGDALHAGDAAKRRTSRSSASRRRDTGVGSEEPPSLPRRRS